MGHETLSREERIKRGRARRKAMNKFHWQQKKIAAAREQKILQRIERKKVA